MTWAKLSDTFVTDPALMVCTRGERLLYVELLSWSCAQGTDGRIPRVVPARISDEHDASAALTALVKVGLLTEEPDGWILTRFADEQISSEEDAKRREAARIRNERWRRHTAGDHTRCLPKNCNALRDASSDASPNAFVTRRDQSDPPDMPALPDPPGSGKGRASDPADPEAGFASSARPKCEHGVPLSIDGAGCDQCPGTGDA